MLNRLPYRFLLVGLDDGLPKDTCDSFNVSVRVHGSAEGGRDGYLRQVKGRQSASDERGH